MTDAVRVASASPGATRGAEMGMQPIEDLPDHVVGVRAVGEVDDDVR